MAKAVKQAVSKANKEVIKAPLEEKIQEVAMPIEKMTKAVGMIETVGIVAAIEAADAMLKTADVTLIKSEKIGSGLVTILIEGDISAVKEATQVGSRVASRLGELMAVHVIPKPYLSVTKLSPQE